MKIKIIVNLLKSLLLTLKNISNSNHSRPIYYRISSIDFDTQTAILHVIHKNIFIKQTFSQLISNTEIIEGLSCQQACWIGVYYGKALRAALNGKNNLRDIKKPTYLLKHKYGRYKIISEYRDGTIVCIHVKTRKELNVNPLAIAEDDIFIKHFDANQACYIGILAGIEMEKKQHATLAETDQRTIPYLRLVK